MMLVGRVAEGAVVSVMRRFNAHPPARPHQPVKLLHRAHHVRYMLDHMNGAQRVKRSIGERIRKTIEIADHVRRRIAVHVNPDRPRIFVDPAADVKHSQLLRSRKQSSSVAIAKSAWSRLIVSGGLSRIVFSPAPRISNPRSNAMFTMRSRSAEARSFVALSR